MSSSDVKYQARVGTVLGGKYHLLRVLGAGGMGAVYEAENTWIKRRVAVKILRGDLLGNEEVVQRFTQEAQAASQIEHPNIVFVLDMGKDPTDDSLYIVQEFLTGYDLRQRLQQSPKLSLQEMLATVVPIMGALAAAHERGIVHRDIKPENIFLARGASGEVVPKLIDFGVSKVMDSQTGLTKTRTGMSLGTPYYMSPEQGRGDTSIDARTDIWSVAVVMFEALAGAPPFDAPNYNLLILKILTERPPRIESVAPEVPAQLAAIIHTAMEPDREARFPSMRTFLDAVMQFASTRGDLSLAMPALPSRPPPPPNVAMPGPAMPPRVQPTAVGSVAPVPRTPTMPIADGTRGAASVPPGAAPVASFPSSPPPGTTLGGMGGGAPNSAQAISGMGPVGFVPPGGAPIVPTVGYGMPAPMPSNETALGWTQPSSAPRGARIGVIALLFVAGLGASTAIVYALHHRHHPHTVATIDDIPPSTRLALTPLTPIVTSAAQIPIVDAGASTDLPSPAQGQTTIGSHPGATRPTTRAAHGNASPATNPTPAPVSAPQPAPRRTATVAAPPADPAVQQGYAVAQQLQYRAQQYAAYDPRRANRMYAQSARLQQEVSQLRSLELQERQYERTNPDVAAQFRAQADRQRERVQRMATRFGAE